MPKAFRLPLLLFSLLILASCDMALKQTELPTSIQLGDRYFAQFVIRYEKDVHITTNYRGGDRFRSILK